MSELVEHHRGVQYRVRDFALLTSGVQVTTRADGQRIEVTGVCPACGGQTTMTWSYGSGNGYKGGLLRRRSAAPPPVTTRTVCCDCGHAHADRPDDAVFLGCGAYWQVDLST